MKHIISLGAGVQSSTMALMAAHGDIEPMPDAAIFADTGWEPKAVYRWLDMLEGWLPFPVYRVSDGNIRDDLLQSRVRGTKAEGVRWVSPPLYTLGENGEQGMIRRQCTSEYKLKPLRRKQRELVGLKKGERAKDVLLTSWIGISLDEMQRMSDSSDKWAVNRYPLVEQRMTRGDCLHWMAEKGYTQPPRSACVGCPFRSNAEWRTLTDEEWLDACYVDDKIRNTYGKGVPNEQRDAVYLHADRIPLYHVDIGKDFHDRQYSFLDECEGMCGV